jgi:hypothetical protein
VSRDLTVPTTVLAHDEHRVIAIREWELGARIVACAEPVHKVSAGAGSPAGDEPAK